MIATATRHLGRRRLAARQCLATTTTVAPAAAASRRGALSTTTTTASAAAGDGRRAIGDDDGDATPSWSWSPLSSSCTTHHSSSSSSPRPSGVRGGSGGASSSSSTRRGFSTTGSAGGGGGDDDSSDSNGGDSSSSSSRPPPYSSSLHPPHGPRRVWKSPIPPQSSLSTPSSSSLTDFLSHPLYGTATATWDRAVDDAPGEDVRRSLDVVARQEREGGRMLESQLGVVRTDPGEDMRLMIENYTVPALASALRDREDVLQRCASLLAKGDLDTLSDVLEPFERRYVEMRRKREDVLDLRSGFAGDGDADPAHADASSSSASLEMLRKGLSRMPRRVSMAHQRRAAVVLPLCDVDGVPCVLFEKRSRHLRAHPDEVCLPGGMVSVGDDKSIVSTCLREMGEEIEGLDMGAVVVLGVLRCNWGEVHHLTGIAVTPVVCYIGEISHLSLAPNPDEVAECFTVPLSSVLNRERWVHREGYAPIFTGGPHLVWGLTGYIVERFLKDVMARYNVKLPPEEGDGGGDSSGSDSDGEEDKPGKDA